MLKTVLSYAVLGLVLGAAFLSKSEVKTVQLPPEPVLTQAQLQAPCRQAKEHCGESPVLWGRHRGNVCMTLLVNQVLCPR